MIHPDDYADQRRAPDALMRHNFQISDWLDRCAPCVGHVSTQTVAFWCIVASGAVSVIAQWWV